MKKLISAAIAVMLAVGTTSAFAALICETAASICERRKTFSS